MSEHFSTGSDIAVRAKFQRDTECFVNAGGCGMHFSEAFQMEDRPENVCLVGQIQGES